MNPQLISRLDFTSQIRFRLKRQLLINATCPMPQLVKTPIVAAPSQSADTIDVPVDNFEASTQDESHRVIHSGATVDIADPLATAAADFDRGALFSHDTSAVGSSVFSAPNAMEPAAGTLEVMVRTQYGTMIAFHVRSRTSLGKLMNLFCSGTNTARANVRFLFDGLKLRDDDTPASVSALRCVQR